MNDGIAKQPTDAEWAESRAAWADFRAAMASGSDELIQTGYARVLEADAPIEAAARRLANV